VVNAGEGTRSRCSYVSVW